MSTPSHVPARATEGNLGVARRWWKSRCSVSQHAGEAPAARGPDGLRPCYRKNAYRSRINRRLVKILNGQRSYETALKRNANSVTNPRWRRTHGRRLTRKPETAALCRPRHRRQKQGAEPRLGSFSSRTHAAQEPGAPPGGAGISRTPARQLHSCSQNGHRPNVHRQGRDDSRGGINRRRGSRDTSQEHGGDSRETRGTQSPRLP